VAPYYLDFWRAIRKALKRPKLPSETTIEYATAYAEATRNGEAAVAIAADLDRVLFSSASLSKEEWANLRKRISLLAKEAKQHAQPA
jgi:ElaB/YqjD/DUF883 family membrane-anchored ribosome-binding protein